MKISGGVGLAVIILLGIDELERFFSKINCQHERY